MSLLLPLRMKARRNVPVRRSAGSLLRLERLEDRVQPAQLDPLMSPTVRIFHKQDSVTPFASSGPQGYDPASLRHAYGVDLVMFGSITGDGAGQTIAIVDAGDQPNLANDLTKFDAQFGLPDPPSFTKINQTGGTTMPAVVSGWTLEISLDVEWAHAFAPKANIVYIGANSASLSDLITAVDTARNLAGVCAVSMSWGADESSGLASFYDSHFKTPSGHTGVTFINSSGDYGAYSQGTTTLAVEYPAASVNVLGVGGTKLTTGSGGSYVSETAWGNGTSSGTAGGAGGGISSFSAKPAYQNGVANQSSTKRMVPDVALDADPNSGVAVYDSYDYGSATPWIQVGGTSLSAPLWAGLVAVIDQGRVANGLTAFDGATGLLPALYALPAGDFHDITTGNNGYAAAAGYDLVTGRGSPVVNLLVNDLTGMAPTVTSITPNAGPLAGGTSITITGTRFSSDSTVTIGGVAATNVVFVSSTQLTAQTPPGSAGSVSVAITATGGGVTVVNGFTYVAAPTIASLTPNSGVVTGGTLVTINGTNFTSNSTVTFGGVAGTSVTFVSATQLTVKTPANQPLGSVDVVVTTDGGSATSAGGFTFTASPVLLAWDVNGQTGFGTQGLTAGAVASGITNSLGLTRGSGVSTAGNATLNAWGGKNWQSTSTAGINGNDTVSFGFTVAAGSIASLSSLDLFYRRSGNTGPSKGYWQYQINGGVWNLIGDFTSQFPVSSGAAITEINLAGISGLQNLGAGTVVNLRLIPYGGSSSTATWYIYDQTGNDLVVNGSIATIAATTTALTAATNPSVFGQSASFTVAVSGGSPPTGAVHLKEGSTVLADGTLVNGSATFNVSSLSVGAHNLTAVYDGDSSHSGSTSAVAAQVVAASDTTTTLTGPAGPVLVGASVTFTATVAATAPGAGLPTGSVTFFDGSSPLGVVALAGGAASLSTSSLAAGTHSITASFAGDSSFNGSQSSVFSQTVTPPAPTLTSVSPGAGPLSGASVTIVGTNFTPTSTVTFGGVAAASVTYVSATQLTATAPATANAGSVDVAIATAGGTATLPGAFTYLAAPVVTSVAPFVGPTSGGNVVTITGANFTMVNAVRFGSVASASYTVLSSSQITAVAPAAAASSIDVTVVNPGGASSTAGTANDYTYAAPAVVSVVVNGGDVAALNIFGLPLGIAGQSSVVEQLLVTFNQQTLLDPDAFAVTGLAAQVTGSVAIPSSANVAVISTPVAATGSPALGYTQYVLTFAAGAGVNSFDNSAFGGHGNAFTTLADGLYQLALTGAKVHAGGDTAADETQAFWSLFGASNPSDISVSSPLGYGADTLLVDGIALSDMYATFGSHNDGSSDMPQYRIPFDWNLDGLIDGIDLSKMYANFGTIWHV